MDGSQGARPQHSAGGVSEEEVNLCNKTIQYPWVYVSTTESCTVEERPGQLILKPFSELWYMLIQGRVMLTHWSLNSLQGQQDINFLFLSESTASGKVGTLFPLMRWTILFLLDFESTSQASCLIWQLFIHIGIFWSGHLPDSLKSVSFSDGFHCSWDHLRFICFVCIWYVTFGKPSLQRWL